MILHGDVPLPDEFPLQGTGFVPCPMCATTFTDDEMAAVIAARRSKDLPPFPQEE